MLPVQNLDISAKGLSDGMAQILESVEGRIGPARVTSAEAGAITSTLNDEFTVFQNVERLGHVEGYEAYLAKFPNGVYSDVARRKIRSLRGFGRFLPRTQVGLSAAVSGAKKVKDPEDTAFSAHGRKGLQ